MPRISPHVKRTCFAYKGYKLREDGSSVCINVTKRNSGLLTWYAAKPVSSTKESTAFFLQRDKQEEWAAHAQKPQTPWWLQGRVFKVTSKDEGHGVHDQLVDILLIGWWWGNRVVFQDLNHQPSGSNQSGVLMLVVSMESPYQWWWL